MTFAVPIALTLAALAVPIIALYILKVRLRRVPVSTNLFWKQIYEEKPPRSIWQHFRHLLSLLLQLLLLLLIVLAIADPYFSWQLLQARRLVIVVDHSASMRAADVAPSRLDAARAAAIEVVEGIRFRDEMAVVLAGNTPEVVVGMTSHAPTLREAIRGIQATDSPTRLDRAIELGRQLIGSHPHGQVIVMTDGCVESNQLLESRGTEGTGSTNSTADATNADSLPADADRDGANSQDVASVPVEFRLFVSDAANVGITQLQVRRSLIDPLGYEILASVKNASASALSCRLELTLNDIPVDVIPLTLKPDELWSRAIEKTSLEGGPVRAVLTQVQNAELDEAGRAGQVRDASDGPPSSITSNLVGQRGFSAAGPAIPESGIPETIPSELNALTTDDTAWALLPSRSTQRVLIVTRGNLFLQKVFEANPLVDVTVLREPPDDWPADSIIVLHGDVPETIPSGNVFVVDPEGSCDLWDQGPALENPIVTEQDQSSPLMKHIRLDNVVMPEARQLQFRTAPHSLAKTLSGDIVYAELTRPNGKCLVLSVNLDRSDLAFRTAFPIMVANSLGWYTGQSGELQEAYSAGSMASLLFELPQMRETRGSELVTGPLLTARALYTDLTLKSPSGILSTVGTSSSQNASETDSATSDPVNTGPVTSIIGPLNEVGIWTITENSSAVTADESNELKVLAEVAVNLASERESDLRPSQELVDSPQSKRVSPGWFSRPLWFYLILVASVLTTAEWFLYQRRFIS